MNTILYKRGIRFMPFFFLNLIFVSVIYFVTFFIVSQISPIFNLQTFNNDYLYCYNERRMEKFFSDAENKEAAHYSFSYVENEDGSYSKVIYMDSNASKIGIPVINSLITFVDNDLSTLEKNKIYTCILEKKTNEIDFYNYCSNKKISTIFITFAYDSDFICINDDYINDNGYDFAVYTKIPSKLENTGYYNTINSDSFCCSGKYLVENNYDAFKSTRITICLISLIPILFSIISLFNVISYLIEKEKNDIMISRIFYSTKNKQICNYYLWYFSIVLVTNLLALIASLVIFQVYYLSFIILFYVVTSLFENVLIYIILNTVINKSYKSISWGELYD